MHSEMWPKHGELNANGKWNGNLDHRGVSRICGASSTGHLGERLADPTRFLSNYNMNVSTKNPKPLKSVF